MMTENMKKFAAEIAASEELRAKIEALGDADDAVEQTIAIAAEYGFALTEEDLYTMTEEDFEEGGDAGLSLDDLDSVAGGGGKPELVRQLEWKRGELLRWAHRMTGGRH